MSVKPNLPKRIKLASAIIIGLCMVFGALSGVALASNADASATVGTVASLAAEVTNNEEAETCGLCHGEVIDAWDGSSHQQAYHNDHFQQGWESQEFDESCLDCHTTGFLPSTGEFTVEGVSCTACHGNIPGDHPNSPVDLSFANTVCKDCHTVTTAEFRTSLHHAAGLECTSCHYAHSNGLRLETEVAQCLNCHEHQLDDFAHASHVEGGLTCRNCHGYVEPGLEIPVDGLAATGHDFRQSVRACLDCHEDVQLAPVNDGGPGFSGEAAEASFSSGEEAALRISELENTVSKLQFERNNQLTISAIQGTISGLVVGGLVVWLLMLRAQSNEPLVDDEED